MKLIELIRDSGYIIRKTVDYLFVIPVITIILMIFVDAEFNLNMFIEQIQQIKRVEHLKVLYVLSLLMSFFIFIFREITSWRIKRNGFYCEQFGFMIKKSEITAKKEDENDIYHFSFASQEDVRKTLVELLGKINNEKNKELYSSHAERLYQIIFSISDSIHNIGELKNRENIENFNEEEFMRKIGLFFNYTRAFSYNFKEGFNSSLQRYSDKQLDKILDFINNDFHDFCH
jgi:hypothetical protein